MPGWSPQSDTRRDSYRGRSRIAWRIWRVGARRRSGLVVLELLFVYGFGWGLAGSACVYVPVALLSLGEGWGIVGVWCGLTGLIAVPLVTCGVRFAGSRWALTGACA